LILTAGGPVEARLAPRPGGWILHARNAADRLRAIESMEMSLGLDAPILGIDALSPRTCENPSEALGEPTKEVLQAPP